MIKTLDAEIVDLIEDEGDLADEIEQADTYKEMLYESKFAPRSLYAH